MPIFKPRVNLQNFQQGGGATAGAISALGSIFQNNAINVENARKRELLDLQIQQMEEKAAAGETEAAAEAAQQASVGESFGALTELFSPTLEQTLPTGVEGPVLPGISVGEKLEDPASVGIINKAQFNLARQGFKPADIANLLRSVSAQSKLKNEQLQAFSAGAGGTLGPNEALTVARQNKLRAENQANLIARDAAKKAGVLPAGVLPGGADAFVDPRFAAPQRRNLFENAVRSTGVMSGARALGGRIQGFVGDIGPENQATLAARQDLDLAKGGLVRSLSANSRFPVAEIKRILADVNISPSVIKSPGELEVNLRTLDSFLSDEGNKAARDARDLTLPSKMRESQAANAANISNFLQQLGVPRDPVTGRREDNTFDDVETLRPAQEPSVSGAPVGVDPLDWQFMSPEDKALWQQ